jgi:hypothetical protein
MVIVTLCIINLENVIRQAYSHPFLNYTHYRFCVHVCMYAWCLGDVAYMLRYGCMSGWFDLGISSEYTLICSSHSLSDFDS